MKKSILLVIFLLATIATHALDFECVGTAHQIVNGSDTVFLFAKDPQMRSNVGAIKWYRVADDAEEGDGELFDAADGEGYYINTPSGKHVFYVVDFSKHATADDVSVEATPSCGVTTLEYTPFAAPITYRKQFSTTGILPRHATVQYTNTGALDVEAEMWKDSAIEADLVLDNNILTLDTIYRTTDIVVLFEPEWREKLNLPALSVTLNSVAAQAIKGQLTHITTVRGEKGERSNEVDRPTDSEILTGSAPLDILFKSNPTEKVEFYQWRIYRGNTLLAQRTDQDTRFTFNDPGAYVATCYLSSSICPCAGDPNCKMDSIGKVDIIVSESQLLVPNVFTPNGDGKNDEFRVQYRSIREFHCWVYNRWGKLVYEWSDPAKGWDGTINGRPAAEGAYFYVIRAMGTDAEKNAEYMSKISYNKRRKESNPAILGIYQLSGDINLLRGKK